MTTHLTESRLANLAAQAICEAFAGFQDDFGEVTRRARSRFHDRDWAGIQADMRERLEVYRRRIDRVVATITDLAGDRIEDRLLWASMKAVYSGMIADRSDWEIAETFFNSVTRRIFTTVGVDPHVEFVATDFARPPTQSNRRVFHTYVRPDSATALAEHVLTDYRHEVLYSNLKANAAAVGNRIDAHLKKARLGTRIDRAEFVTPVFYRGQRAYIVGRLFVAGRIVPAVLALCREESGIAVDAVLMTEVDVSILFSFTRSYFHVDVDRPYDLVRFLSSLMPRKRLAELYISIGYHKHGKTELYRDLLHHVTSSGERFEVAPGQAGLVMLVFTMPGFDVVIKVMRDRFAPPKETTHADVRDRYRMVFKHDRAGRLVDAQEFEFLQFPVDVFDEDLLDTLLTAAPSAVHSDGSSVVIDHAYVERRVVPLDLFIRTTDRRSAAAAVLDYGAAIKDLARSNIFPGDMLTKNFGVTRHGRVVFYDYDELTDLAGRRFRKLPEPQSVEDEMAAEPWFGVAENDIFPEEFGAFLGLPGPLRAAFERHHLDLLDAGFWESIRRRIVDGDIIEIVPYGDHCRVRN